MIFLKRLQKRWKLKNLFQVIVVLIVFTCTGFTVMFIKKPALAMLGLGEDGSIYFSVLYYIFILPVYFVILFVYGFVFGQYSFFRDFIGNTWGRLTNKKKQDGTE